MAYTSITAVRARLPLLTEEVRSDDQVQDFIAEADAVVDAHVRVAYILPLAEPVDPLVGFAALELACGLVLENVYGEETPDDVNHPQAMKARAFQLLEAVRAGTLALAHPRLYREPTPRVDREKLAAAPGGSIFGLGPRVLGEGEEE